LLDEVAGLSDKLTIVTRDLEADGEEAKRWGVDKIPGLIFEGKNAGKLRYFGVPAGYEFGVLVQNLLNLSTGRTHLSDQSRQGLKAITSPVHLKVLVTPT
jgi:alkyl hydroperoxide reductase subunit AhpF